MFFTGCATVRAVFLGPESARAGGRTERSERYDPCGARLLTGFAPGPGTDRYCLICPCGQRRFGTVPRTDHTRAGRTKDTFSADKERRRLTSLRRVCSLS